MLSAPGSVPLSREILYPQESLERDFEKLMDCSLEEVIRQTEAEIEMFGLPSAVRIMLLHGDQELTAMELPLECVDATVFPYLVAWLLEWCAFPEFQWGNEVLKGSIVAEDCERGFRYGFCMAFHNRHLSEGLYERTVALGFSRGPFKRKTITG